MATVMLLALSGIVISLGAGATWHEVLHWAGEVLLILGVLFAAIGIRDVRREFTERLGIADSAKNRLLGAHGRLVRLARSAVNYIVRRFPRLAGWLRWHELPEPDTGLHHDRTMLDSGWSDEAFDTDPPEGGTVWEHVAWLEKRIREMKEVQDLQSAALVQHRTELEREQAERAVGDRHLRDQIGKLAGGGLLLQTLGVVFLLAGTAMTAIWP